MYTPFKRTFRCRMLYDAYAYTKDLTKAFYAAYMADNPYLMEYSLRCIRKKINDQLSIIEKNDKEASGQGSCSSSRDEGTGN